MGSIVQGKPELMKESYLLVKWGEHRLCAVAIELLLMCAFCSAFILFVGHSNASWQLLQVGIWKTPRCRRHKGSLCDDTDSGEKQEVQLRSHREFLVELKQARSRSFGMGKRTKLVACSTRQGWLVHRPGCATSSYSGWWNWEWAESKATAKAPVPLQAYVNVLRLQCNRGGGLSGCLFPFRLAALGANADWSIDALGTSRPPQRRPTEPASSTSKPAFQSSDLHFRL